MRAEISLGRMTMTQREGAADAMAIEQGATEVAAHRAPDSRQIGDPAEYAMRMPYAEFARLRREAPVAWIEETTVGLRSSSSRATSQGGGYWAITRYATLVSVSRRPEVFSSAERGSFLADPKSHWDLERTRQLLINMDAPQHGAVRRLLTQAFTPAAVQRLHQSIRMHAEAIVRRVLQAEEFDAVLEMAAELPLLVLADLLGMPREDRHLIYKWSNTVVGFDDPDFSGGDVEAYQNTFSEAFAYAREMADAKRKRPADDLVSVLVNMTQDGYPLSDKEFSYLWIMLAIGGNESTRHLISGSLQALSEWPGERSRLAADPALLPAAIEELLRWVSPIIQFRRTAVEDTELDGRRIHAGDKVVLYYCSANRDEEIFERGDQLILDRRPNPHLAFGIGPHFCLGAHLARLEALTLFEQLCPHLDRFELTGPVVRLRSNFMNGIKSMPARFAPS
jgi:cytochrome P450